MGDSLAPPCSLEIRGLGGGGGSGGAGFLTACRPVRNPYGIGTGAWEGREGLSAGCWLDLLELGEQFQGHTRVSAARYKYDTTLDCTGTPSSTPRRRRTRGKREGGGNTRFTLAITRLSLH